MKCKAVFTLCRVETIYQLTLSFSRKIINCLSTCSKTYNSLKTDNLALPKNAGSTRLTCFDKLSTAKIQGNFKPSEASTLKLAGESKHCSYLLISFSCPPKAITVRIAARTSSATAPAFAYAACSLSVKAERT